MNDGNHLSAHEGSLCLFSGPVSFTACAPNRYLFPPRRFSIFAAEMVSIVADAGSCAGQGGLVPRADGVAMNKVCRRR